jgi:large subunit ribosomal protein L9
MSIEIILREHVEHLGDRGEIVKVSDGYARNFLLPRKLALPVTSEAKKQIERERAVAEQREAGEKRDAESLGERLAASILEIARRVGDNNTLYGSVTTSDIAEALAAKQIVVDRRKIQLTDPLKALGEYVLPVKLHRNVTGQITVRVVPA